MTPAALGRRDNPQPPGQEYARHDLPARPRPPERSLTRRPGIAAVSLATGIASVGLALATPGVAHAATPATVKLSDGGSFGPGVTYTGGTGNANNLRIFKEGAKIAVTDAAPITASAGCVSVSPSKALCDSVLGGREVRRVSVRLGDLNDTVLVDGAFFGQIFGDAGNDLMFAGKTTFNASSRVSYNGGAGRDTVSYQLSPTGVSVTMDDVNNDGRLSGFGGAQFDNVRDDVEQVTGSNLADKLTGDEKATTFTGLGGNDTIDGGTNVDRLSGGDGDDTLRAKDGSADFVEGGAGSDSATRDSFDSVTSVETIR